MKVRVLTPHSTEVICDMAAAKCTRRKADGKSLKHSLESGHESVLEHLVFSFEVSGISRVTLAQLTRHRIASYSVESQRYTDCMSRSVVVPDSIQNSQYSQRYKDMLGDVTALYQEMLESGIPKEDARYILPEGTETSLILTMNARELRHFFSLRCCERAQWEIRELANKMLRLCREYAPTVFADAGAPCVRGECPEKKPCGKKGMGHEH